MGEYVIDPSYFDIPAKCTPLTPYEALMTCDFGEEPEESALEREGRRQAMGDLLDVAYQTAELTDYEREILDAIYIERVSLRDLEDRYCKTNGDCYKKSWVANQHHNALRKLRLALGVSTDREVS